MKASPFYNTGLKRQKPINLTARFIIVHRERVTQPYMDYRGRPRTSQQTKAAVE
jgi:hypothetical protein